MVVSFAMPQIIPHLVTKVTVVTPSVTTVTALYFTSVRLFTINDFRRNTTTNTTNGMSTPASL